MDDENGIELSLGLSCGGSPGKRKCRGALGAEEGFSASWEGDDQDASKEPLRHFLNPIEQKQDPKTHSTDGVHDGVLPDSKMLHEFDGIGSPPSGNLEFSTSCLESFKKRKFSCEGNVPQKRHEGEAERENMTPHATLAAEDASSLVKEDMPESDAENSTSQRASQGRECIKHFPVLASEVSMDKLSAGNILPTASDNSFAKLMPSSINEQTLVEATDHINSNQPFGYSMIQLPVLENFSAYSHQLVCDPLSSCTGSEAATRALDADALQAEKMELGQVGQHKGSKDTELLSSSLLEDKMKSDLVAWRKISAQLFPGSFLCGGSTIRPGVAADLQFGGCGSCPDLPWVSTTGTGPHGRTISGVTYRYGSNKIKIVCACHGTHLSPEEFVQHANSVVSEVAVGANQAVLHSENPISSA